MILYVVGIICEHQMGMVPPWVVRGKDSDISRGREENNLASWLKRFSQQTEMYQSIAVFFSIPCEYVVLPQMRACSEKLILVFLFTCLHLCPTEQIWLLYLAGDAVSRLLVKVCPPLQQRPVLMGHGVRSLVVLQWWSSRAILRIMTL